MPQQSENQVPQSQKPSPTAQSDAVGENVLRALGRPQNLFAVQVRPLWGDHYRVNVLVGADVTSIKIAHSYFLTVGLDGSLRSEPAITATYAGGKAISSPAGDKRVARPRVSTSSWAAANNSGSQSQRARMPSARQTPGTPHDGTAGKCPNEVMMAKIAITPTWVVYLRTVHNHGGFHAVCEQSEWAQMELARPGYHTLIQSGITTEVEAERLARGPSKVIAVPAWNKARWT
jgi:hypothetical protein